MLVACLFLIMVSPLFLLVSSIHPILFPQAKIASYVLQSQLGSGIHGQVWRVSHQTTGNVYAMKCMTNWKMYHHEVAMMRQVGPSEWTIGLIATDIVIPAHYCFVMEYADGGSLSSVKTSSTWRVGERQGLVQSSWMFYRLLHGLHHMHQRGIVHMDVAERNVVFMGKAPKWTDFSLAMQVTKGQAVHQRTHFLDLRRLGHVMHGHYMTVNNGKVPRRLRRLIRRLRRAGPRSSASNYLKDEWWQGLFKQQQQQQLQQPSAKSVVAMLTSAQVVLGGGQATWARNTTVV